MRRATKEDSSLGVSDHFATLERPEGTLYVPPIRRLGQQVGRGVLARHAARSGEYA